MKNALDIQTRRYGSHGIAGMPVFTNVTTTTTKTDWLKTLLSHLVQLQEREVKFHA